MATNVPAGSAAATASATQDFTTKAIGAAEVGAGAVFMLIGMSLLTGIGKAAVKTGVRVAKVVK